LYICSRYARNPHIAEVFFKAGYIEGWGRGTTNIIHECLAYGLPEPHLAEDQGGLKITFRKNIYTEKKSGIFKTKICAQCGFSVTRVPDVKHEFFFHFLYFISEG
jgi:predicted HTH transcriptional regulator